LKNTISKQVVLHALLKSVDFQSRSANKYTRMRFTFTKGRAAINFIEELAKSFTATLGRIKVC
jgi:hypothetical protein